MPARRCPPLLRLVDPEMLLLVDQGFPGYELWEHGEATGSQLCWWMRSNTVLAVVAALADGSHLSTLAPPWGNLGAPITIRVVECTLSLPSRAQDKAPIWLVTTLLDPQQEPARALAALYGERLEHESTLDEPKTHQRGAGRVLRSKSPERVVQEIHAHLLITFEVRSLIKKAAEKEIGPDRVSFVASLRVVRRQATDQTAVSLSTCKAPSPTRPPRCGTGSRPADCGATRR